MIEPVFPKPQKHPISVSEAIIGCLESTDLPLFNDKYAKLWSQVPVGGSAADVIGQGFNNCRKLDPDRPSNTLPKMQTGRGFATICHWAEQRAISIPEAKRIASFPDNFKFIGKYSEQWARIGNSVPPNFMKAIAETIRDEILEKL